MLVYVAQISYPADEPDGGMMGEVLCVGSEWNRVMKQVMEHYERDLYADIKKLSNSTWQVHIDGDLYVDVTKFVVDEPIPSS